MSEKPILDNKCQFCPDLMGIMKTIKNSDGKFVSFSKKLS